MNSKKNILNKNSQKTQILDLNKLLTEISSVSARDGSCILYRYLYLIAKSNPDKKYQFYLTGVLDYQTHSKHYYIRLLECGFKNSILDIPIPHSSLVKQFSKRTKISEINVIKVVISPTYKLSAKNKSKKFELILKSIVEKDFGVKTTRYNNFYTQEALFPKDKINLSENYFSPINIFIDTFVPIGLGQRSFIAAPPKSGKTKIIEDIYRGMKNTPGLEVYFLLVGERPEEETHFKKIGMYTISSTFDDTPETQIKYTNLLIKYVQARAMSGVNCFILMDSLTRLVRSYNAIAHSAEKRTLSGGLEYGSLLFGKKLMGMARVLKNIGSIGIISTCLFNTESKMDDAIYQEFKGTCNSEIYLDYNLAEASIYPSFDINKSRTRNDHFLNGESYLEIDKVRRLIHQKNASKWFIQKINIVKSLDDFFVLINDLINKNVNS